MINTSLNYVITIYPVGNPDRQKIIISNPNINTELGDKYGLIGYHMSYDILAPANTNAVIMLHDIYADQNDYNLSTVGEDIKRGDIVLIQEQNPDLAASTLYQNMFVGYIENILTSFTGEHNSIVLTCPSPIKQIAEQQAIRTLTNAEDYSTDNFTQWTIFQDTTIAEMLDILLDGTILQLAHDNQLTGGQIYKFVDATGSLAGKCDVNSPSWVWVQPTTMKLTAIDTVLYPYQYLYYIDQNGTLILTPLSTRYQAPSIYSFSVLNTQEQNDLNELVGVDFPENVPVMRFDTIQSLTANRYITTLMNANSLNKNIISVQDLSGNQVSSSSSINVQTAQQIFSRQQELLETGYYTQQILDMQSITDRMFTDPILMNLYVARSNPYLTTTNSSPGQIRTVDERPILNGVLQLFGGRALSAALVKDTMIMVSSDRSFTVGVPLPLGQMITIDPGGRIDEPGLTSFLCRRVDLMYNVNDDGSGDATLVLGAIKPFTHIFCWDE